VLFAGYKLPHPLQYRVVIKVIYSSSHVYMVIYGLSSHVDVSCTWMVRDAALFHPSWLHHIAVLYVLLVDVTSQT
jgi:hypothetical protein